MTVDTLLVLADLTLFLQDYASVASLRTVTEFCQTTFPGEKAVQKLAPRVQSKPDLLWVSCARLAHPGKLSKRDMVVIAGHNLPLCRGICSDHLV